MASSPEPHVVIGRHPDHGIVATNPAQHHVVDWYFERCNFSRVPGHPFLYAFDGPPGTEATRTQAMVGLMRRAGFTVEADLAMPPNEPARGTGFTPDVAFAEHPQLGLVAATASTHLNPNRATRPSSATAGCTRQPWTSTRSPHRWTGRQPSTC